MYQEWNHLDGTPATHRGQWVERVSLPTSAEDLAAGQAEYERLRKLPHDELAKRHRERLGLEEEART